MMSESVEIFGCLKQESHQRRAVNRENSAKILNDHGVKFESKNLGAHLIVSHDGHVIDFWPGTGKFIPRRAGDKTGRGVFNLLRRIGAMP